MVQPLLKTGVEAEAWPGVGLRRLCGLSAHGGGLGTRCLSATPTPAGRRAAEGKGPWKEWGLCSSLATQHLTSLPLMGARHGGALLGVTFVAGRAQVPPRGPRLLVPALPTGFLTNPGASASFPPHNSLGAQVASRLYGFINTDEPLMPDKFFRLEMLTEQLIIWEKPERPVETTLLQAPQAGRPGAFSALWPVTGRHVTQAPGVGDGVQGLGVRWAPAPAVPLPLAPRLLDGQPSLRSGLSLQGLSPQPGTAGLTAARASSSEPASTPHAWPRLPVPPVRPGCALLGGSPGRGAVAGRPVSRGGTHQAERGRALWPGLALSSDTTERPPEFSVTFPCGSRDLCRG